MKLGKDHQTPLLHNELRWLVSLRWVAGAVVVIIGGAQWMWLGWYQASGQMLGVGLAILAYNAVVWWTLKPRATAVSVRALHVFGLAQIAFDLACLTLLAAWTGGMTSPAMGFFVFHMVFASVLLTRGWAFAAAAAAILMLGGALWTSGQWTHDRASVLLCIGWASSLLGTVYLTSRITRALFRRERSRLKQFRRMRTMATHLEAQERAMVQHDKMVSMGQMAAGVAHEINNPLAGMDSLLQLMERNPEKPRPEAVGQLREQVQRIQRIVRQLTAFAHPERGRPEVGDINEVVRSTLKLPGFEARLRKVKLDVELDPAGIQAHMISRSLQQALMNLIINGLDALADTPEATLQIRTRRDGLGAAIEVADNGPGIAPENMPRIFEPFFTTKPVGQGTGLGLSISQGLVAEQGGRLEVVSPASPGGRGARFTIRLAPASAATTTEKTAVPAS